jgi:hypothetical protein
MTRVHQPKSPLVHERDESGEAFEAWCKTQNLKSAKEFRKLSETWKSLIAEQTKNALNSLESTFSYDIKVAFSEELRQSASLTQLFGLFDPEKHKLKSTDDGNYYYVEHVQSRYLLAKVTLNDGVVLDPAIIYPAELDAPNYAQFRYITVGGAVKSIEKSQFALPIPIIEKAQTTLEYRMSTYMPLLVSIGTKNNLLVPAHSLFLKSEIGDGSAVDPKSGTEPKEEEQKKGMYVWGDPLIDEIVLVLGNIPGFNEVHQVTIEAPIAQIIPKSKTFS